MKNNWDKIHFFSELDPMLLTIVKLVYIFSDILNIKKREKKLVFFIVVLIAATIVVVLGTYLKA